MGAHSRRALCAALWRSSHDAKKDFGSIRIHCAGHGSAHVRAIGSRHYRGTVKDSSSAVMPGVQVRVTNVDTNAVETASTDETGFYRVGNLAVGNYVVSFSKNGFKTLERKGVTLLISQVAEVDATLQVGGMSESVEVTSAPPILQTEDSTLSANLNNEAVSELPLNVQGSRNLSNFMFAYLPGVEGTDYSSHINGGMAMTKEVLIDGTSAVSQLAATSASRSPPWKLCRSSRRTRRASAPMRAARAAASLNMS